MVLGTGKGWIRVDFQLLSGKRKSGGNGANMRDRWCRAVTWFCATAVIVVALTSCADVRNARLRTQCREHLNQIHSALRSYGSANHDLPRNTDGEFTLHGLDCDHWKSPHCVPEVVLRCPASSNPEHGEYVVNSSMTHDDIAAGEEGRRVVVIACDSAESLHDSDVDSSGLTMLAMFLLSDGRVVFGEFSPEEYDDWIARMRDGTRELPSELGL